MNGGIQDAHGEYAPQAVGMVTHWMPHDDHVHLVTSDGGHALDHMGHAHAWHKDAHVRVGEIHPSHFVVDFVAQIFSVIASFCRNVVTDPTGSLLELAILLVAALCFAFTYYNWEKVCYLLTGDVSLHFNHLEWLSKFIHCCCGNCEWTRNVCCCLTPRNVFHIFGQALGFHPISVKISNIIVGDLPGEGRVSYYLKIEMQGRPVMRTSVVELRMPKVVHFPETLFLTLRRSLTESDVIFTVMQHVPVGQTSICEVRFRAVDILGMCDTLQEGFGGQIPMRRFEMQHTPGVVVETPSWIYVNWCYPTEALEHIIEDPPSGMMNLYCLPNARVVFPNGGDGATGTSLEAFKHVYPLCDPEGIAIDAIELKESQVRHSRLCTTWIQCFYSMALTGTIWVILLFTFFRYYVRHCFKDYRLQTIGRLGNDTRMFGTYNGDFRMRDLKNISKTCRTHVGDCDNVLPKELDADSLKAAIACCPKRDQILFTCKNPVGGRRPVFLDDILQDVVEADTGVAGLTCREQACEWAVVPFIKHDVIPFIVFCSPLAVAILLKCGWGVFTRWWKKHKTFKQGARTKNGYDELPARSLLRVGPDSQGCGCEIQ